MPRKHRILLLLTLLLLGLAGGAVALGPETLPATEAPQATASPQLRPSIPSEPSTVASLPPVRKAEDGTREWVAGTKYRYQLSTTQEISFTASQPGAGAPPGMRFHLQGEWSVGIVSVDGEEVRARIQLVPSSAEISVGGENRLAPEVRRSFEAGLAQPFFITLHRSGAVQLVHFEPGTDILVQGLLRATVGATQLVLSGPLRESWTTEEQDSTGRYSARYTRKTPSRFEKSKLAYSHLSTPEGLQPLSNGPRVSVSSVTTLELGKDLWAESIQGREHLEVDSGPSLFTITSASQVTLTLLERARDRALLGSFAERQTQLVTSPLASYQGQGEDPKAELRQVLAGKTFDALVKELHTLPADEKASQAARSQALAQLRALFLLEPRQALLVHDTLRAGMEPMAASPLLGALSSASTPESLHALSGISTDGTLAGAVRVDATAALAMASTPTDEGVTALRKLAHDTDAELADTATLGLGSAAMMMNDGRPRDAEALVQELVSASRSATSPEQQALLLRALGNTRHPSALPTLQAALASTSPEVRAAAVEALRNMPAPSADQLLASVLLQDPTAEVRQSAVFASSFRPLPPLLPVLAQALRLDSSDLVRREIITLAGGQLRDVPEARSLLEWSSQNDPSPGLRHAALTFLSSRTP